ncbi:DUF4097 family beta strand repeat-containing protein [Cohnella silvisoli]|uniref:DUF4097 family beta strand repeat-containing protein n=1 Tax=Cohnella silvisoli TaxID=2873699 RepID=A0ABV1KPX6_9BACL|nr:DUF4097 family beta strand repeat-containing protein [Cohnella silvisoli]MCD9022197.1 DUF4097 domain-containing protein [Cohnella silvisoli]
MKKLWYLTAIALILIGLAGVASYGWKSTSDKLPEFEKTWTFAAADLRKLHIVSDYDVNISFVKSTDGTNSIQLKGHGTDKMIEKAMKTEISSQSLKFDLTRLPKKYINFFDFNFDSVNEDFVISVTDDSVLDSLNVKVDSGTMNITDAAILRIADADLTADSGNITINNFKSDRLNVHVDSGKINGNKVTTDLTATASSGNIKFENMTGRTSVSVDSGNIKLYKLDTSSAELSADSGNVYVQVPAAFAGFYDLQADSGLVRSPEPKRDTKDYVKVRTDSGNIIVEQQ